MIVLVLAVFEGFWTIGGVVAVGWFLASRELVPHAAIEALSRVTFTVATPVLLFTVISAAPLGSVLGPHLAITLGAALTVAAVSVLLARRWGAGPGETVIGAFAAGYVNAGNLGIPIAVYVLGDAVYATPVLLGQLLVLQPIGLAVLDSADPQRAGQGRLRSVLASGLNPLTVASLLALAVAASGWQVPQGVRGPLDLIAGLAVPAMLLAFGMSLRWGPVPFVGGGRREVVVASVLKLIVMPLVAWGLALAWGLEGHALLVAVVTAALPTAQNVFLFATIYRRGEVVARDAVFATTMLSLPVVLAVVALLG